MISKAKPNVYTLTAWLALATFGAIVRGDLRVEPPTAWVAYVSVRPEADDLSYRGFRDALARIDHRSAARVHLTHHHIAIDDEVRMRQQIGRIFAQLPVVVVTPTGAVAALAAPLATRRTPVVFSSHIDPVVHGIVGSWRASGRFVTGAAFDDPLDAKRIELLRDAHAGIRHVAVLADPLWPRGRDGQTFQAIADATHVSITVHHANDLQDVDAAIARAQAVGADAWYVPYSYLAFVAEPAVVARLAHLGQPAIFASPRAVRAGALMSYWQDNSFAQRTLASLVSRVVQGEDPATIPIERPKRFVLEVRGDANAVGMRVDPSVVRRADVVR